MKRKPHEQSVANLATTRFIFKVQTWELRMVILGTDTLRAQTIVGGAAAVFDSDPIVFERAVA